MADDSSALIAAGAQIATTGINAMSAADTNRKQRKWMEGQYQKQLDDGIKQWHMQNEYNSPQKQMERLQLAGLNPNLVYGNGATTTANSPPAPPSVNNWNPKPPQIDGNAVGTYYNVKAQQAQYDNLKAQNTVLMEEALLKQATRNNMDTRTAIDAVNLSKKPQMVALSLEAMKQAFDKQFWDVDNARMENQLRKATFETNVNTSMAKLDNLRAELRQREAQTGDTQASADLKKFELHMRKLGVSPNDPFYWKAAARFLDGVGISINSIMK